MNAGHDAPLWSALEASFAGRVVAASVSVVERAARHSRAIGWWRRARTTWLQFGPAVRMRAIGIATATAVVTHVVMQFPHRTPGGWWLIVPGIVMIFAVAALWLPGAGPRAGRGRA